MAEPLMQRSQPARSLALRQLKARIERGRAQSAPRDVRLGGGRPRFIEPTEPPLGGNRA